MQHITWGDVLLAAHAVIEARGADSPAHEIETLVWDLTSVRNGMAKMRPPLRLVAND